MKFSINLCAYEHQRGLEGWTNLQISGEDKKSGRKKPLVGLPLRPLHELYLSTSLSTSPTIASSLLPLAPPLFCCLATSSAWMATVTTRLRHRASSPHSSVVDPLASSSVAQNVGPYGFFPPPPSYVQRTLLG